MKIVAVLLAALAAIASAEVARQYDTYSNFTVIPIEVKASGPLSMSWHLQMVENGVMKAAAPECRPELGWIYHKGFCYMFTSYHTPYLEAEELCNQHGAYLADILTQEENNWIKSVLKVINPKDGTDYFIGGLDADRDKEMYWVTGAERGFNDFVADEPKGRPYLHMDFDLDFQWNTKDDANDQDNGFICKKEAPTA